MTNTPLESPSEQDPVAAMESLFGCIPADLTLEEAKEERRSQI